MGAIAILFAVLTLVGWQLGLSILSSLLPGRVSAKPNSAIALVAAGVSLWRIATGPPTTRRYSDVILAAVPGLIGGVTLAEYGFGLDLGIDQLLYREPMNAVGTSSPGRMAPNAALSYVALSIALVSLSDPKRTSRNALWLAGAAFFISVLALTGYLYGVEPLYGIALYTRMAMPTVLSVMALSVGTLCLRPDHGFIGILTSQSQSGYVARLLLPAGFLIPLGAGWLRLTGQRADLFRVEFGAALSSLSSTLLVTLVILWATRVLREQELGRLHAESELDTSQRDLERLELEREIREQFVRAVTHDLRNPLTAGKTRAEMILHNADQAEKCRANAVHIMSAIDRTDRMIRDMLDASRLRAGQRLDLRPEKFALQELIREVADEQRLLHGDRFELRLEELPLVHLGRAEVRRLLENLVTNAVKYGDKERPITVSLRREEDGLLLAVHNHGKALTAEEQSSLFTPFYRARSAQSKSGWGIGLTLVKGIVEAHGGSIRVESGPACGTTFLINLPLAARDDLSARMGESRSGVNPS